MIRTETENGWFLITHPEHAALAGRFADAWGNEFFPKPEPYAYVREAVYVHDDGWISRDASPLLTREGKPSAFSRELVGAYSAFEEIDLADYLAVRGRALDAVAERSPFAAIVVSMHTVNLLTEQADLSTIRKEDQSLHAEFIADQRFRQQLLSKQLQSLPTIAPHATASTFDRAFRFLQCCDSFSLIACVGYDQPRALRHAQPTLGGKPVELVCRPLGRGRYSLTPWPFIEDRSDLTVTGRRLDQKRFETLESFRAAYGKASPEILEISLSPG